MAEIKRLYRSKKDRILGGVCGGMGKYFGIDSNLVRLLFVLLAFAGGAGIIVYLAGWLIIPEETSR
ncbi:MAG TPA: PspC domain-containing protein [Candidatus Norongarragalinales archaeon]|nr:PspC domain-containing protein [Candidatus Norongarragalinales archaeon]